MSSETKNSIIEGWPEARRYKRSIRLEFSLYVSGVILILMLVTGWVITGQYVETVTQQVVDKLLVQTRSYSGPAGKHILSADGPDALMLNNICKKLEADNPNIYWVGIAGQDNVLLAHSDLRRVISGERLTAAKQTEFGAILLPGESFELQGDTITITTPIRENDITVGHLGVACSTGQVAAAKRQSIIAVASITLAMILLGVPLTLLLLHRKLRPLTVISDELRQIDFQNIAINIPYRSRNEFGYLSEILRVMGTRLNVAQRELVESERMARELEIAREIQANILPREFPGGPDFEFHGTYRSAREVGGDYYDFITFDEHRLAFVVADVSGKSLPGMLVMLLTRDIVKEHSRTVASPSQLLSQVNRELMPNIKKGMFVTMFYGILDSRSGRFSFASAGHNPLIRIGSRTGEAELIKTRGFPLGMMPPDAFAKRIEESEINLEPGDWLIQYTDGVNEAQNVDGEEFGMNRFVQAVKDHSFMSPGELINGTLERHTSFVGSAAQYDDITLLAMKWRGNPVDTDTKQERKAVSTD